MPRKSVTFAPVVTGPNYIALEDIPADVKKLVDDSYEQCRKQDGNVRVEYDTVEELELEFKQMVSYAAQRPNGVLKVRKSPVRNLPETVMAFRVTSDPVANGARNAASESRVRAGNHGNTGRQ